MRREAQNRTITNSHNADFVAVHCRFCIARLRDSSSPYKAQVSSPLVDRDSIKQ